MDAFAIAVFGVLAALVIWVWLLGKHPAGTNMQQFGLRSAREITEDRESLEAEDLQPMLEAHNVRRRRRGERARHRTGPSWPAV